MKAENFEERDVTAEPALGKKLAGEIWNDKLAAEHLLLTDRKQGQPSKHLNETQITDGGGLYIKFSEGRGLSEVGGYVTTRAGGGEMTLMGGIELKEGNTNEYLLGFDYKEREKHPKRERSQKPEHPSADNPTEPKPRPEEPGNHNDKPDSPNRPVRPHQPPHKATN